MAERVLVIGAGMAGLCVALVLSGSGRRVTLLERDGTPPQESPDQAFFDWDRRGVAHLRHSHAFLARLRSLIKGRHPTLLRQLLDAGCREIGFADVIPRPLHADYRPWPGDADLTVLTSRRTTLEWVMRAYVEGLADVEVIARASVRRLILETPGAGQVRVVGLAGDVAGAPHEWRGDPVIDAGGKTSSAIEQLIEAGAAITEECEDCGIVYFTRHYRLLPGVDEPPRGKASSTGDLGFIKYGLFPGDNRCFSITLATPEIETELRQAVVRPQVFDRICAMFPGIAPWTDPTRAEPISKVFGMGDLKSRWRSLVAPDQRATLGFFAVGDSLIRTNPLYGRGCSFAAIQAEILGRVLDEATDPAARARLYDARIKAELTPYFDDMRDQDRAAVRRAGQARDPAYVTPRRARMLSSFVNDGVRIAVRSDIGLMRAALRDFHMIEPPGAWLQQPANLAKVLRVWARGRRRNADLYPPPPGPGRGDMMRGLGLTDRADAR